MAPYSKADTDAVNSIESRSEKFSRYVSITLVHREGFVSFSSSLFSFLFVFLFVSFFRFNLACTDLKRYHGDS